MKTVRQLHFGLGVFFSPLIMFFAFTGALQTFSLHEGGKTSAYVPPAWLVRLARIHKNQRLAPGRGGASALPLKWLVALMAAGLITTSFLGIYLAFRFGHSRLLVWGLLVAGIGVPLALLFLQ